MHREVIAALGRVIVAENVTCRSKLCDVAAQIG